MFKKLAIISFAFFILAGNFSSFAVFSSLPIDISVLSMIVPGLYFMFWTLKTMSLHKSLFIVAIFFLALIPTIFYSGSDIGKLSMFLMIFFVLAMVSPVLLSDKQSVKLFINTLFITSLSIVFLTLSGLEHTHTTGRLTLYGGNPIWLARSVSIAAFCLLIFLLYNKISRLKFLLLFAPTIFVMISTGSKGPLLSMIIALVIVYFGKIRKFITNKKTLTNTLSILFFSLPVLIITYILFPEPFTRILDLSSESATSGRLILYKDALSVIENNPFGIGLGNFGSYSYFDYPHNLFLEALAELGWVPGILFITMIFLSFIGLKHLAQRNIEGDILIGIFIMAFINSMVSGDMTSPKELYLLMPIGLNVLIASFQIHKKGTTPSLN